MAATRLDGGDRPVGRSVVRGLVLVLAAMFAYSVVTNPRFEWDVVGEYLFSDIVLQGLATTILLTVVAMVVAVAVGLPVALARMSPSRIVSSVGAGYVLVFRGVPLLVQLMVWYNLSSLYPEWSLSIPGTGLDASGSFNDLITPLTAAVLGLALNEAAYMAEIVRSGLISVPVGQTESAAALGMPKAMRIRRVILPQAMRMIIPAAGNQVIRMFKTTSLVSVIAVTDLLYTVQLEYASNLKMMPLLITASIWYLALTTVFSFFQALLERHFGRSDLEDPGSRDAGVAGLFRPVLALMAGPRRKVTA